MNFRSCLLIVLVSISVSIRAAEVPGTRVILEPPAGFERAAQFPGFILTEANASVLVNEIPGPYLEIRKSFTAAGLADKGMKLLKQEDVGLSLGPGFLLEVSQTAYGVNFLKWLLAFESDEKTILIAATYPASRQADYRESLRKSLLGVTLSDGPVPHVTEGMTFRIDEKPPLNFAHRIGNGVVLTKESDKTKDAPLLVIGSSITQGFQITQQREYAKQRLGVTATISHIEVFEESDVVIDGLHGVTLLATAKNVGTGKALFVMQTMLFDEHGYYLALGMANAGEREIYQQLFAAIIASFQRIKD